MEWLILFHTEHWNISDYQNQSSFSCDTGMRASSKGWRRTGEEKVCEDRRSRHLEVTHVWATHPPTDKGRLPRACSPHIWPTRVPPDPIFHWRTEITNTNTLYVVTPKKIVGQKPNVNFFMVAPCVEVPSRMGFLKRAKKRHFAIFSQGPVRGVPKNKIT